MAKINILLVDDEQDFLNVMTKRIEGWGYRVEQAMDGKEAMEAVKNKNPDIVVLDYKLPDMDGIEVLKKIHEINKDMPVIMITAYPSEKVMEETARLGINAYIPKISAYAETQSSLKSAIDMIAKKVCNRRRYG